MKLLGTGLWNEPRVFDVPALQGGMVRGARQSRLQGLRGAVSRRFNTDPIRLATLSYDAVTLAAALDAHAGVAAII